MYVEILKNNINTWVGTPDNIKITGELDINQFVIGKMISKVFYLYFIGWIWQNSYLYD